VWLIDPRQQTLEILQLEKGRWSLTAAHESSGRLRAEPFSAIELELANLWG
jgi:Uma2 family endonuclease